MIFIMTCHIGNYYHNVIVSQLFNIGVPLFFVISGILCARREISSPKKWLIHRFIRLYMPLLAWILYSAILASYKGQLLNSDTWMSLLALSINLQGLRHIFPAFPRIDGPWFFTVIMICYLIAIYWKKLEVKYSDINSIITILLLAVIVVLLSRISILLDGVFFFFGGYILEKMDFFRNRKLSLSTTMALMICSCMIRLLGKIVLDGSWLYDHVIVFLCSFLLTIGIIITSYWIEVIFTKQFIIIMKSPISRWIDSISAYVYCFHEVFIFGPLTVFILGLPVWACIISIFIGSFILATILYIPFETLGRFLNCRFECTV